MADFGDDAHAALIALCAAMAAIVIWATAAWYFGIPTSESHALIAGLSGAAIAIQGDLRGINRYGNRRAGQPGNQSVAFTGRIPKYQAAVTDGRGRRTGDRCGVSGTHHRSLIL